jgi:hypothetical protein
MGRPVFWKERSNSRPCTVIPVMKIAACRHFMTEGFLTLTTKLSLTILVAWWSELLTANHEVSGSIPGSAVGIFPCSGRSPHLDIRPLLVHHAHTYNHHPHHRGNVTAPYRRPKLRSRLHFGHNPAGGPRSLYGHMGALGLKNLDICSKIRANLTAFLHPFPHPLFPNN